jgi:hypothetical protein
MKYSIILCTFFMLIILAGCKKNPETQQEEVDPLVISAKNYFKQNQSILNNTPPDPRFSNSRFVQWDKAKTIQFSTVKAVIAPVQYPDPIYMHSNLDTTRIYSGDQITWLCIYLDNKQQYHIEQVGFFPDINFKTNGIFTGLISVDNWQGIPLTKYIIQQNEIMLKWNLDNKIETQQSTTITNSAEVNVVALIETCNEVDGYNYSVDDPEDGSSWVESEGCSYSLVGTSEDGIPGAADYTSIPSSGGGGSSISSTSTFSISVGLNIIANIVDYNKCFTNIAGGGNSFSVTVCVEQPQPGTRIPWVVSGSGAAGSGSGTNPINVGHAFLIFSQSSGVGTITRNIGFYPSTTVNPSTPSAPGQLNNDALNPYNVSLTIQITNSQFFNMLNYVAQGNGLVYNLNTNNCTSFVLKALNAGNISLPSTIGSWAGGTGNDPGDLGEDIMSLALSTGMSRSTTILNHPNLGTCN